MQAARSGGWPGGEARAVEAGPGGEADAQAHAGAHAAHAAQAALARGSRVIDYGSTYMSLYTLVTVVSTVNYVRGPNIPKVIRFTSLTGTRARSHGRRCTVARCARALTKRRLYRVRHSCIRNTQIRPCVQHRATRPSACGVSTTTFNAFMHTVRRRANRLPCPGPRRQGGLNARSAAGEPVHQGGEAQNTRHSPAAPTARVDAAGEAPPRDTKL